MERNENRLLERAMRGDAEAFSALMEAHERRMYAVALQMMRNREDAQDCLQDAMLRVYRAIGGFKGQSAFSTWVYRIQVNTCLDELRKRKNDKNTSMEQLMDVGWSPTDPNETPEQGTMRRELGKSLRQAIDALPEDMRRAVVLRDIQGFSYDEIAETLDINVGTVKSRLSRAREKLREKIRKAPELFGTDGV